MQKTIKKTVSNLSKFIAVSCVSVLAMVHLSGCVGQVVGAAADVVIETAKIPVKVGKGVVDVVTPDGDNN